MLVIVRGPFACQSAAAAPATLSSRNNQSISRAANRIRPAEQVCGSSRASAADIKLTKGGDLSKADVSRVSDR